MLELTNENFEKQALEAGRPVLVEFWAPWCGYCRRISPAYEKVADQYQDKLLIAQVNTDEEPQLAGNYQIEVIPTLLLFQNGQPVASIVAPESKASIDTFLREHCPG